MTDLLKTYIITNPSQSLTTLTLSSVDMSAYTGFIYYIMGSGGIAVPSVGGGSSGYTSCGYIDLEYPYIIDQITVTLNPNGKTILELIPTTGPSPNTPIYINADSGSVFEYTGLNSPIAQYTGFFGGACGFNSPLLYNQRGGNLTNTPAEGSMTSDFGTTNPPIYGGGGFYGGGATGSGPYGYSAGSSSTSVDGTLGYAILSFIPKTIVETTFSADSGATGTFNPGTYLYSGVAGGGGGGGGYMGDVYSYGGGGGGSGENKFGFLNTQYTGNFITGVGGIGGTGTLNNAGGIYNGGYGTTTNLITTELSAIILTGGDGGIGGSEDVSGNGNNGSGGNGWYGGGKAMGGVITPGTYEGASSAYIQSYFPTSAGSNYSSNGGGGVTGFGEGNYTDATAGTNAGGGGGGWYSGDGGYANQTSVEVDAQNAVSFGCSGGGGAVGGSLTGNGGNGSGGFILLKKLIDTSTIRLDTILASNLITPYVLNFIDINNYKGVWIMMGANSGNICHNTFHFLIIEDNVRKITVNKDVNNFINVSIDFSILNGKTQNFFITSTSNFNTYMNLLLYV